MAHENMLPVLHKISSVQAPNTELLKYLHELGWFQVGGQGAGA